MLNQDKSKKLSIVVLGAGPAGLTAAWCLKNNSEIQVQIFESDSQVGGISKTVKKGDWSFDLGGHRFFSKSTLVNELWDEMLFPDKFIVSRVLGIGFNIVNVDFLLSCKLISAQL